VVHTPKQIRDKLPYDTDFSVFWSKSDNFQPSTGSADVLGNPLPPPSGKTVEKGFTIETLNGRLDLKVNWYNTQEANAVLGDATQALNAGGVYLVGYSEGWGLQFAKWAQLGPVVDTAGVQGGSTLGWAFLVNFNRMTNANGGYTGPIIDPSIPNNYGGVDNFLAYEPEAGQSVASAYAAEQTAINTFLSNPPPQQFYNYWSINNLTWNPNDGSGINNNTPSNLGVNGATTSSGVEYEVSGQPIKGWDITFNASHTTAVINSIASSFSNWITTRYAFYSGPAGNVRFWNGYTGGETLYSKFTGQFYGAYELVLLNLGSDVPELRPWRANLVTDYTFQSGALKGFNVGGAYRWEDKQIIGYPVANGVFDLATPYKGPINDSVDVFAGYERKITDRLKWRIQVNIRNLFANDALIPVNSEPDGTMATGKIPEPRTWEVTNSIKF